MICRFSNGYDLMASKREKLLSTTKDLLWEIGYESMSPRRVLDASGAGQGSLYHHFKGKLDLAATALEEVEVEMKEKFDSFFDPALPPLERIHRFLQATRDGVRGCRLGRFANESAIAEEALRKPIAEYFLYVEKQIHAALEEAIEEGSLPVNTSTRDVALTIMSSVQGGFILSRVHKDPSYVTRATAGAAALLKNLSTQ